VDGGTSATKTESRLADQSANGFGSGGTTFKDVILYLVLSFWESRRIMSG